MRSIVVSETKALARRHLILEKLAGRLDIRAPDEVSPALTRALPRLLVAGLDYDSEPGTGGWPLPTGGRYRKLCFSPLVEQAVAEGLVDHDIYILPTTQEAFEDYVALITGIPADHAPDLYRIFRITPEMLFEACADMRRDCPVAWRLLLSNEHKLAVQAWPALRHVVKNSPFKHPLIHGFMMFAEFERAGLIMRQLTRVDAIFDRRSLIEVLKSGVALSKIFTPLEIVEVHRWLEYLSLSTASLRDLLDNRSVDEILAMPKGYAPWALARGELPGDIDKVTRDASIRDILIRALDVEQEGAPKSQRKPMLADDWVARFYGMTNEVLPIVALEGARERFPTHRARAYADRYTTRARTKKSPENNSVEKVGDLSLWAMSRLASAMRTSWDPERQQRIVAASETYVGTHTANNPHSPEPRSSTLEINTRLGLKMARVYLPTTGRPGAAARFDPRGWDKPDGDRALWTMFSGSSRHVLARIPFRERYLLRAVLINIRRVYAPLYRRTRDSKLTVRLACDLATAISPVSANPQIAFAIANLQRAPNLMARLGFETSRGGFGRGQGKKEHPSAK